MVFSFDKQTVVLSVLSYAVVLLLPGMMGVVVFWKRSRLRKRTFQKACSDYESHHHSLAVICDALLIRRDPHSPFC